MLIALVGPRCSGKYEIAKYLIVHHYFRPAFVGHSSSFEQHAEELLQLCNGTSDQIEQPSDFSSIQALLEHSTAHWRDNIVTLDLKTRAQIEIGFDKRPFFLLIGVDAPVTLRWKREVKR
jgi:dCMP deaminase